MMIRRDRRSARPIHQAHQSAAMITIPKLPTKVDVLVGAESPLGAIRLGAELQDFMNMADMLARERLGSGRMSEDIIDVEPSDPSTNGHARSG